MIKLLLAIGMLAGLALSLAACETTEGFGKDVKHAGQHIENSAEEHK